jgi:hypothetical protein
MARIARSSMFPSAGGTRRTTSIKNTFSVAGYAKATVDVDMMAVQTLSGSMTAGTLKTFLDEPSVGCRMPYLSISTTDATARTLRIVVTVDGVPVYDFTSSGTGIINAGAVLAGKARSEASGYLHFSPDIVSTTSLKIEAASSVTETDKLLIQWIYNRES